MSVTIQTDEEDKKSDPSADVRRILDIGEGGGLGCRGRGLFNYPCCRIWDQLPGLVW